jgi:tetratricopeptide (TPR) repeat protein
LQVDTLVHLMMLEGMRASRHCDTQQVRLIGLEILDQANPFVRRPGSGTGVPGGPDTSRECWTLDRCGELVAYVVAYAPDPNGGTNLSAAYSPERSAPRVPESIRDWGVSLGDLERVDLAIAICDEAIARNSGGTSLERRVAVATALVDKGLRLEQFGQREQAIAAYDEAVASVGDTTEPELLMPVAMALVARGGLLWRIDRAQAFAAYDEVIARFGEAEPVGLRCMAAQAILSKGVALEMDGHDDQAAAFYEDVIARFGDSDEPQLSRLVALAQSHAERTRVG